MELTNELWAQMAMTPQSDYAPRYKVQKELSTLPDATALTDKIEVITEEEITAFIERLDYGSEERRMRIYNALRYFLYCRRPAAQAQEPQPVIGPEGVYAHGVSVNPAPVEQEAEGDMVNKMLTAYDLAYKPEVGGHNHAMRAAYAVSRQHFTAHPPEGWHTTEQVKTATEQAAKYCNHMGLGFGDIWEQILYGLTPPQKPDPAVPDYAAANRAFANAIGNSE